MRIAVIGASGRTGRSVVAEAARRGHTVIALSRSAPSVEWPAGVLAAAMDVVDADATRAALDDATPDAAVFAVGIGASRRPTTVYSAGIANVLAALPDAPLCAVSAVPAADGAVLPPGLRALRWVLWRFFGATYRDMQVMERTLLASDAAWECLRAPRLTDGGGRGGYRVSDAPVGGSITCSDLATALLDTVESAATRGATRRVRYITG